MTNAMSWKSLEYMAEPRPLNTSNTGISPNKIL